VPPYDSLAYCKWVYVLLACLPQVGQVSTYSMAVVRVHPLTRVFICAARLAAQALARCLMCHIPRDTRSLVQRAILRYPPPEI